MMYLQDLLTYCVGTCIKCTTLTAKCLTFQTLKYHEGPATSLCIIFPRLVLLVMENWGSQFQFCCTTPLCCPQAFWWIIDCSKLIFQSPYAPNLFVLVDVSIFSFPCTRICRFQQLNLDLTWVLYLVAISSVIDFIFVSFTALVIFMGLSYVGCSWCFCYFLFHKLLGFPWMKGTPTSFSGNN